MNHYRKTWDVVWKVEYWCGFSNKRKDFLGVLDVLVFNEDEIRGIQDTTWGQTSARKRKIISSALAWEWLQCPSRTIEVIGWKEPDKEKGRHRWEHKIVPITLEDFPNGRPKEIE